MTNISLSEVFLSSKDIEDLSLIHISYSGVRPLCDDESDSPQAITRDYTLDTHDEDGKAPLLSVFGIGLAIREAREKAGLSRNDLGDKVFYGERHIADIENIGSHPSFQLFQMCIRDRTNGNAHIQMIIDEFNKLGYTITKIN